ncbi:MAG: aspartate carbamoyltransferase catalytic subunit [Peptococcaceae bacterium]|nr:aspartate carbamoyltransferase catalytic subunit [Peptococcaceae bacterium]
MGLKHKDLISINQLSVEEIKDILALAREMREQVRSMKQTEALKGVTVVNLFYENSTRTRSSFELAAKYQGANVLNISASSSSVQKGEGLKDTAQTINAYYPDVIVMRHPNSGAHELLAKHVNAHVINAGDGMHEHPTQALLDFMTICDYKKELEGLKVVIVGDLSHSRVVRSNLLLLNKFGCDVTVCGPATLVPGGITKMGAKLEMDFDKAIKDADVVMMLRIQLERQKAGLFPSKEEYTHFYGLNKNRLALAKPDAIVLHPGPINRGIEIDGDVADGPQSKILEQVTNGLCVRMALLKLLTEEE